MNIFYLDKDPVVAAKVQYNKHVVKMILESAQMLCAAHHIYGSTEQKENVPYKLAHKNHPSTIWTRTNNRNYMWLYWHMIALGDEYTKRYNKTHLTITKCEDFLRKPPVYLKDALYGDPVDMPQCMPDEYKDKCSIKAYWNYYIGEKHIVANPKTEKIYNEIPGTVTTAH